MHRIIYNVNRIKKKNHTIISTDLGKVFDKLQHPFIIKTLQKLGIERCRDEKYL
jgi:hypothetical protein